MTKTIKELADSISRRAVMLGEPNRTRKSIWHHRNMIKLETKKIQEIISATEDQ